MKKTLYSKLEENSGQAYEYGHDCQVIPVSKAERIGKEYAKQKARRFIIIFMVLALVAVFLNAIFLKSVVKAYGEEMYKTGLQDGYKLRDVELKLLPDSSAKVPFIPQPLKSL